MLSHGRNGLSVRRMAGLYTCREPSLCRSVHRECMRSALLDLTPSRFILLVGIKPTSRSHHNNLLSL
jgi:hypothetical protein